MKHLAAYLLLNLAGKTPDAKEIKKLLKTVGIEADDNRLKTMFSELEGKDINELITEGSAAAKEEAPAEEKKDEKEDESDEDMGFGLFD
ncbi:8920_t:CDS:2 [Ambispora leptoticha]|uniref:8920_t:CDS:1 n=1 Tax=Ambispora leptoticha TaxID=144679 RepID=A0A9N9ED82_9GLOM|nr:8920_t:CDS:2 [Ambispora leptoticha]